MCLASGIIGIEHRQRHARLCCVAVFRHLRRRMMRFQIKLQQRDAAEFRGNERRLRLIDTL